MNQIFSESLENSNDQPQPLDHMKHLNDQPYNHSHHHPEQLTHQPSSSSASSTSSSVCSFSSPLSPSQTIIGQSSPSTNQNTTNNNDNNLNIPKTKLFVGRLPENCASNHLEELFSKYGQVTECDVVGRYGFVHMSKSEEAEECVKKLNRYSFMGSLLTVEFSTSKVHPEPGTLGRAKGVSRMTKGIRPRIHGHTPYHRDPYHRTSLGLPPHSIPLPPSLRPHVTAQIPLSSASHPPPLPPPGHVYGGYSTTPYYQDSYRAYERDVYFEADYYGRHYPPPPHDHRPPASGGTSASNYEFDGHTYSPPPPQSSLPHPRPPPYPIYSSHHAIPIRAYERPVIDESIPMYTSRGSPMTPHKCHHHKCHYDMHVKPYLN